MRDPSPDDVVGFLDAPGTRFVDYWCSFRVPAAACDGDGAVTREHAAAADARCSGCGYRPRARGRHDARDRRRRAAHAHARRPAGRAARGARTRRRRRGIRARPRDRLRARERAGLRAQLRSIRDYLRSTDSVELVAAVLLEQAGCRRAAVPGSLFDAVPDEDEEAA
jgi:hypothetical protein